MRGRKKRQTRKIAQLTQKRRLGAWLRGTAPPLPILPPLLHCSCKQGLTVNERNDVTRAMVQWCVSVHTTFRLRSWLRGVLWRARWSWTWTWNANNVSQVFNSDLLLPLRVWVVWLWWTLFFGPCQIPWIFVFVFIVCLHFFLRFFSFFFSLCLVFESLALLFIKAGILIDIPGLGPVKGNLILFCTTKNS